MHAKTGLHACSLPRMYFIHDPMVVWVNYVGCNLCEDWSVGYSWQ